MAMSDVPKNEKEDVDESPDKSKLSGFSQYIVGEIETIGGVLTGDPLTQAEGEFNVEVGTVREEIEDELEQGEAHEKQ
jgi:uncharacterized protein YjbJ (UPF0337 family)